MDSHCPDLAHQLSMIYIVKEALDINVNYNMKVAFLHMFFRLRQRIFNAPVGTEAIACFTKFCFTNWLHHLQDTLLYQSVHDGGNPKWSGFAITLGNLFSSDRLGLIPVEFLLYKTNQFRLTHFCKVCDGFPIRTGRSASSILF